MHKILTIAKREYLETVRTRTFLIGVLAMPLLIALLIYLGGHQARQRPASLPTASIVVADLTGKLSADISKAFAQYAASPGHRKIAFLLAGQRDKQAEDVDKQRIRQRELDVYAVIDRNVLEGEGKITYYVRGGNMADMELPGTVDNLLQRTVADRRAELRGVSATLLAEIRRRVPTEDVDVGAGGASQRTRTQEDMIVSMMVPFFFMFLMFMGIFGMGQQILTSVIEEKSSRVMEVLLSAVSPLQLMAGKIVGLAGIGLTVIGIWTAAAAGVARWKGIDLSVGAPVAVSLGIYYILGFLLFTSILAGIGSTCNTLKEAQGLMVPISFLFAIPMAGWFWIAQSPDGVAARIMSYVPPLTPMVMALRLAASPRLPLLDAVLTTLLLAASVPVVIWASAKVFRIGVLMYGKHPGLREIFRWIGRN